MRLFKFRLPKYLLKRNQWRQARPRPCSGPAFFYACLLFIFLFGPSTIWAEPDPDFEPIIKKLIRSGLERDWVTRVFNQPCAVLDHDVLVLRLTVRESKINYGRFLEEEWIVKSRNFIQNYAEVFQKAQQEFEVPPEIIAAVLLLETKLGQYTGRFPVLSTLASHAAAGRPEVAADVYRRIPKEEKARWTLDRAAKRLAERTAWSFNELRAFLTHFRPDELAACTVRGSYTGAMGLCQFQPSNLKPYGRDGNGDGIVDFFQVEDAVFSAANYLKEHGWRPGLGQNQKIRVLRRYNNSEPYARTILEAARRIKP